MDVFIIGSRGVPARYGGFETFVDNLIKWSKNAGFRYHVSCMGSGESEFEYHGARCFTVKVPPLGAMTAPVYDCISLWKCLRFIARREVEHPVIYVLASRIGPILFLFRRYMRRLGIKVAINPDGLEWQRAKWGPVAKVYWRLSEALGVRSVDLVVCDSKEIQRYIRNRYPSIAENTVFIPYGADIKEPVDEAKYNRWLAQNSLQSNGYYLMVGRFVPENNFELVFREYLAARTKRPLVVVTDHTKGRFFSVLSKKMPSGWTERIRFVGAIYDSELLHNVRCGAFAYIHGHEVGGTNPSLLESLAATRVNLLLDVPFNREVGGDAGLYFSKREGSLRGVIEYCESMAEEEIQVFSQRARRRIAEQYQWEHIAREYHRVFSSLTLRHSEQGTASIRRKR